MQTNSIILTIVAVVVLIFVGLFISQKNVQAPQGPDGQPATATAAVASALQVSEPSYDFGSVSMAKGNVSRAYTITNTSSSTVAISKLFTSCMCTQAKLMIGTQTYGPFGMPGHGSVPSINASLAPGESATVEAVFDPAAHGPAGVGPIGRSVYLESNGARIAELTFKAVVTP